MSERIPVTDFEVWLRTVCFRAPPADCHDLAETAWLHQQEHIAELTKMQEALIEWIQEHCCLPREDILEIAEREMKEQAGCNHLVVLQSNDLSQRCLRCGERILPAEQGE